MRDVAQQEWINENYDLIPEEIPQDRATCYFCGKVRPDQFFMEGFWAHDACMDAHAESVPGGEGE